ncbi:Rne/Rng family ribonuclease [Albidovulum inexpectatum]|uniref:Rne/Rng family ribonuclease n=1 Tax=Albidovulum inexpectatum TaxID=196587 RepID=A0A2S5JGU1_9RHOB|nr:ribonuclease E/G [Albidovulum inexpectatum]PPB80650.1 Rne/Rng family ribonuclease [Albidovulum inexpectatum]
MRGRVVVLGQYRGREAAALIVDGQLEDLLVAPGDDAGFLPGSILRGSMDRPVKGMGGAFVRLPDGQKGFLRETRGLAPGRPVIVQVSGHAEPGKALPVTTRVLFKGRLAIVTPLAPGLNISRRIRAEDSRARLEAIAQQAMAGSPFGLVMRSAAEHADDDEIGEEIAVLRDLAERVMADTDGAPELLVDAPGPVELAAREWADPLPDEVAEGAAAFAEHGVEEMIDALLLPTVPLPGGGHMAIEPTRAMVAVDINTGTDMTPAAALKANIAAARDLPRQLRLRGLGGQIAIDFAPMPKRDRSAVEQQLRRSFKGDPTETNLAGWTPLGNFELARKRDRLPLAEVLKGKA